MTKGCCPLKKLSDKFLLPEDIQIDVVKEIRSKSFTKCLRKEENIADKWNIIICTISQLELVAMIP